MTLHEVINKGKRFKRRGWGFWCIYLKNDGRRVVLERADGYIRVLNAEDILANDWEIKEEWYEGKFKEKYPKGVLCWAGDELTPKVMTRIVDYKGGLFIEKNDKGEITYKYDRAEPIKPEEAPAIIGEEK